MEEDGAIYEEERQIWFSVGGDVDDFIFLMRHNRKKRPPSGKPRRMFFCANGVLLV